MDLCLFSTYKKASGHGAGQWGWQVKKIQQKSDNHLAKVQYLPPRIESKRSSVGLLSCIGILGPSVKCLGRQGSAKRPAADANEGQRAEKVKVFLGRGGGGITQMN